MNRDEIEKLLDGTTPGPWRIGSWGDNVFGTGPKDEWLPICRVKRDDAPLDESMDGKDARLIAAAPAIACTALDALARLDDALARLAAAEGRVAALTEALDNLLDAIMAEDRFGDRSLTIQGPTAALKRLLEAQDDARAALANVTPPADTTEGRT